MGWMGWIGWLADMSAIAFAVAMGMLTAFFVTNDQRYDRVAEWAFVVFAIAAIPTMLATAAQFPNGGIVVGVVTAVGIVGVALVGLGELGTALRLVDFRRISPLVTVGFVAFLVWIGVISLLIVAGTELPTALGWLGILTIVVGAAIIAWIIRVPGVMTKHATRIAARWWPSSCRWRASCSG
jgi:hypothetical protein